MFEKFLIRCQNEECKKVLLRENPAIKFVVHNKRPQFSASDVDTGEIIVMPNVYCKHCKHKNLFTEADCVETSGKTVIEKKLLAKKIHEELTVIEKRILASADKEEGNIESVEISDVKVKFNKSMIKSKNKAPEPEVKDEEIAKDF